MKFSQNYNVIIDGVVVGVTNNKKAIEKEIEKFVSENGKTIEYMLEENYPEYEAIMSSEGAIISAEEVVEHLKGKELAVYKDYAIVLDGETKEYVATLAEAEQIVDDIKQEYGKNLELDLGIQEIYSNNLETVETVEAKLAMEVVDTEVAVKAEIQGATVNGVTLSKPLERLGTITSRFGEYSSIRSGAHTGLDVAVPTGTPIYPCAAGTVILSESHSAYGYYLIVDHGNGVTTYYAHCSKLIAKVGDKVDKDTIIGLVGSTGNSTGPHLHLEVRVNGEILNPQNFLYK